MKALLTRSLSAVVVWAASCGVAPAATLVVNCGTTSGPTEFAAAAVLCPQFNLVGQQISAISITISGGISGTTTLTNGDDVAATGVGTTSTLFSYGALSGFSFVNPVFTASFTSGNRVLAPGQTLTVSGLTGSGNGTLGSNTTSFAPYVGAGFFTIPVSTATSYAVTGTHGFFQAAAATNANTTAVVTYTYAPIPPLPENFDSPVAPALPFDWFSDPSGSGIAWTTVTTTPVDSAPNAAFGPETSTVGLTNLNSPAAMPVPAGAWQLRFRNLYNLENTFDGMVLEINIAGGGYADILAAGGTFAVGGYTATLSGAFGNPLAGRSAWTGLSAGTTAAPAFITTLVNLPPAASGQNIQLRWRVGSDVSVTASDQPGARIDTITLVQTPTVLTGVASGITMTGATLNGTVNPHGAPMLGHFDYGLTAGYGSSTPTQKLGGGNVAVAIGGGAIAGLTCGTVYHFRAVATSADADTNGLDATFGTTAGAGCAFTDDPLSPGTTTIRTVHIVQLRSRIDALRVNMGLGMYAWTDPVLVAGATPIQAVHVTQLRTALNEAYTFAMVPLPTYTDPSLAGVSVKAVHIAQLRSAVIALEMLN